MVHWNCTRAAIFISLSLWSGMALSAPTEGRSLPSGEENPLYVKSVYQSEQGEVQFLEEKNSNQDLTAFLRISSGGIAKLKEIHGPAYCKEWLSNSGKSSLPLGCELLFRDDIEGHYYHVQSENMREGNLFSTVSHLIREKNVAL